FLYQPPHYLHPLRLELVVRLPVSILIDHLCNGSSRLPGFLCKFHHKWVCHIDLHILYIQHFVTSMNVDGIVAPIVDSIITHKFSKSKEKVLGGDLVVASCTSFERTYYTLEVCQWQRPVVLSSRY